MDIKAVPLHQFGSSKDQKDIKSNGEYNYGMNPDPISMSSITLSISKFSKKYAKIPLCILCISNCGNFAILPHLSCL